MSTAPTAASPEWDAFISHASEDKNLFVRPLAEALSALGARIWYDEFSLKLGDSLSESIDLGLANSRYGIVVISSAFISKAWPKRELQGLVTRELSGRSTILPIWHGVSQIEVSNFSPPLADKLAVSTAEGADKVALKILLQIRPDLAASRPYEELQHIASGEAAAALKQELDELRESLEEFQCPYCRARLTGSQDVPLDDDQKHWDSYRKFECGFAELGGEVKRPCPQDPAFPRLEDYEILCAEDTSAQGSDRWTCHAIPRTQMARLVPLSSGYGRTEEAARAWVREVYERAATRWH